MTSEYQCLVSKIHNICRLFTIHDICPVSLINNIYVWNPWYTLFMSCTHVTKYVLYPWYTIFISGIHDTQYFILVSIIYIVCAFYPGYTLCLSGIHDTRHMIYRSGSITEGYSHSPVVCVELNDLWDSVRVTKTFRSCRPAWLEMNRKFCPTATTSLLHFMSLFLYIVALIRSSFPLSN